MVEEKEKVAMFRYGVIAALVCRRFSNRLQEKEVRKELLEREWKFPDGTEQKVPERTLRHWLLRYRRYGLDGLYDGLKKERMSKGRYRAIPENLLKRAEELRRELPARSAKAILEILKAEGVETEVIAERTLQRHLKRVNATREAIAKSGKLHERWEQVTANDLWHGDTAHGVWLPDPTNPNKMKKTKLILFVDDATRVCSHGEFYFDERLPSLIDTFSKALLKRGKPRRLLLDNAFIFHSTALELMCAELETELSFCRPRRPQGKGKVERLIRTIKESFVVEANAAGFTDLKDLNRAFCGWLEKYHDSKHSEIDQTPQERWRQDEDKVIAVTPEHIRRALMMRTTRRVQEETGIVYLDGMEYACSKEVAGHTVQVRWHVDLADWIEIWEDGRYVETARLHQRPTSIPFSILEEKDNVPVLASAKSVMQDLSSRRHFQRPVMRQDEYLIAEEFIKLIARYLERSLSQPEMERLGSFFRRYAPMRRLEVEAELKKAIAVKGTALHLRYYLERLEKAVQGRKR